MNGFFFNRRGAADDGELDTPTISRPQLPSTDSVQVQAITASAIFAMLVSKGVLSADEAAQYMDEIGLVLERDVEGPLGKTAGEMLRSYGQALVAAVD